MNKLAHIIRGLDLRELSLIEQDLKAGSIERLIARRRKQLTKTPESMCPVCTTKTDKNKDYALEFGSQDLRQRAVFDAPDCLQYFVEEQLQQTHEK